MERLNWKIPICILAIVTAFNGCTAQEPIKSYTLPNVSEDEITTEAESIVEKLAKEKHVAPQLTDDFVSSYLDMEDFAELKERAKEGIAITQEEADMTEKEILMWQEIIRNKQFTKYTVDDLNTKLDELNGILQAMAEEKGMGVEAFVQEYFGMDYEEATDFIKGQAEKYLHKEDAQN